MVLTCMLVNYWYIYFFFQAEDGIRDLVRSRGLGDVYKRQYLWRAVDHEGEILESYVTKTRDKAAALAFMKKTLKRHGEAEKIVTDGLRSYPCLLYTSDAADERSSVDLGGRRIIKKKNNTKREDTEVIEKRQN